MMSSNGGPKLADKELFSRFIRLSEKSLNRAWHEHTNTQWKFVYRLFTEKNPQRVGGALDNVNIYYKTIPLIGPLRIGGSNDEAFSNIFSISRV